MDKLKEPVLEKITASLAKRHDLNFTKQDVSSLWFLCKQVCFLLCILVNTFFLNCMDWNANKFFW